MTREWPDTPAPWQPAPIATAQRREQYRGYPFGLIVLLLALTFDLILIAAFVYFGDYPLAWIFGVGTALLFVASERADRKVRGIQRHVLHDLPAGCDCMACQMVRGDR